MLIAAAAAIPASAAETPIKVPDQIKAFCIDFNWGPGGTNGFAGPGVWADADPREHISWYEGLGCNVVQTFAVSCNGFAWYKGGVVPEQPGLKHDFLPEMVKLGHARKMLVMGYFCVGANTRWAALHPHLSHGSPSGIHVPLTTDYLDYLCASIDDALIKTGMDGFMIDWLWSPDPGDCLVCERKMYRELLGEPFPGTSKITEQIKLEFARRAVDRAWRRICETAKRAKPGCIIWVSCSDVGSPVVANSTMLREVDWLMNEATDPAQLDRIKAMTGPATRLIQCVVGWGDLHDARRIAPESRKAGIGVYGFAPPGANSLPRPIADYKSSPIDSFTGNDRNIAALARFYNGLPLGDQPASQ